MVGKQAEPGIGWIELRVFLGEQRASDLRLALTWEKSRWSTWFHLIGLTDAGYMMSSQSDDPEAAADLPKVVVLRFDDRSIRRAFIRKVSAGEWGGGLEEVGKWGRLRGAEGCRGGWEKSMRLVPRCTSRR